MSAEIRVANDLLIDLYFLGEPQVVGDPDHHDAIENRFVGVIGLELLPLRLVGMGDNHGIHIDQAVSPRSGHHLSWVAVIIQCRYSISFLKTSINSTTPRLPILRAPFNSKTRGSPSE